MLVCELASLQACKYLPRPANCVGSLEPSSKKDFELQENVEENVRIFEENHGFGINHVLVFNFFKSFFKYQGFLWKLSKFSCENAFFFYFIWFDLKYFENHTLL